MMRAVRTGSGLNWGKRCLLRRKIPDEVGLCERLQISVTREIIHSTLWCHLVAKGIECPYKECIHRVSLEAAAPIAMEEELPSA